MEKNISKIVVAILIVIGIIVVSMFSILSNDNYCDAEKSQIGLINDFYKNDKGQNNKFINTNVILIDDIKFVGMNTGVTEPTSVCESNVVVVFEISESAPKFVKNISKGMIMAMGGVEDDDGLFSLYTRKRWNITRDGSVVVTDTLDYIPNKKDD